MATIPFETLSAGLVPPQLVEYMSPGDWSAFHIEVTKARGDSNTKACLMECAACWCLGLWCAFCFHPCIVDGMGKSKLAGCCNRANKRSFQNRSILSFDGFKHLHINTAVLLSLPKVQPQVVGAHSPMQQYAQHPQMMQQQPQMMMMQPQYDQNGQLMQPQMMQQPQMMPQPQMQQQQQQPPPMVDAVVMPDQSTSTTQKIVEEDAPTNVTPPAPPAQQRVGEFVVSDATMVGTTVNIKTPDGQLIAVAIPADCPVGAKINYSY